MTATWLRTGLFAVTCLWLVAGSAVARESRLGEIGVDALPQQATRTLELIRRGGPFPFDRDGVVFGNRERALPARARGYYHEYTVKTPGMRSRGALRIVCGGEQSSARDCYYSDDHYRSFRRIR
ncbi:MAG: ribonuclease [Betaproteobacteria bacterium]